MDIWFILNVDDVEGSRAVKYVRLPYLGALELWGRVWKLVMFPMSGLVVIILIFVGGEYVVVEHWS